MEESESIINKPKRVPFFLRATAILILVSGVFGFIFYFIATAYYFTGQNFFYDLDYRGFSGSAYYFILVLQMMLNCGLIVSAVQLLRLRLTGIYMFTVSFLVLALLSFILQSDRGLTFPIIGILFLVIIFLHKRRFVG